MWKILKPLVHIMIFQIIIYKNKKGNYKNRGKLKMIKTFNLKIGLKIK